jgi:hypothetical protein
MCCPKVGRVDRTCLAASLAGLVAHQPPKLSHSQLFPAPLTFPRARSQQAMIAVLSSSRIRLLKDDMRACLSSLVEIITSNSSCTFRNAVAGISSLYTSLFVLLRSSFSRNLHHSPSSHSCTYLVFRFTALTMKTERTPCLAALLCFQKSPLKDDMRTCRYSLFRILNRRPSCADRKNVRRRFMSPASLFHFLRSSLHIILFHLHEPFSLKRVAKLLNQNDDVNKRCGLLLLLSLKACIQR